MHSIAVECLPGDLVEAFKVDVSKLEIGQSLHISDLNLGSRYKVLVDQSLIVAGVSGPKAEEEPEAIEAGAEPEVITEKKDAVDE
jgi:large subunit ribosomal protein L25